MLRNKEIQQIDDAIELLDKIWEYIIHFEDHNLCDKTGITTNDIYKSTTALNCISIRETNEHKKHSKMSTEYKKIHKERRNILQNLNYAKKTGNAKKIDYWTKKLEEYKKEVK